ncbi:FeS assembly protein SufD [Desmospora sp. 8437]|uniref:Fe-S cluster assembly protein SufD n=2 Tax=Kroppenstedtia eburnea TaxID=714067 RepID=A0A1N7NTW7_9BACL|nr:Fe-S cluster assembly protein SufD [Kroppenstedtia eburnea]EGK08542.1 FeS assembly protein SufD [Desmospora sp. 8437]SIT01741.1 Fe-S cluster assembly protein SufD [Kroppenstedtia eburnea]
MMNVDTGQRFDRETIIQLSQSQQEPDWMLQRRLSAWEQVDQLPLPKPEKTRIDRWNFTDFQPIQKEEGLASPEELPEELRSYISGDETDNLFIQKNSSPVYCRLPGELSAKGVLFTDLPTAVRNHGELVRKYFMTDGVKPDEHKLTALHAAWVSGGLFLYVPKDVAVEIPFQALFWTQGSGIGTFPHLLVVAEAGSDVNVVANFISDSDTEAVINGVVEVFAGDNSRVRIASLHTHGQGVTEANYRRTVVGRDADLEWIVGDLNSGKTLSDNTTQMNGSGGNARIKGITVGAGDERSNITATVNHWGTHTESDITVRGVMKDQAQTILNGITKIEKGARKANGVQAEKVLMLSGEARGDANPILLIDENDVQAGHAASVGRIDPIQMFYLMSRGLTRREAERLLIFGFVGPVLDTIPFESLRERISSVIERKLG